MNIILLLYLVLVVAPISNFIHELGHLIGAKLAKADEIVVLIGRGKSILRLPINKGEINILLIYFTSGMTESKRKKPYTAFEMMYITFFGPLFNMVVVFIAYWFYLIDQHTFILVFMLYNSWLFLMNSIPFKINNQESDGYVILKKLFSKKY